MGSVLEAALEEHEALADTLTAVGPGAPTLIEDWTTTELAAHIACLETFGGMPLFLGRQLITRVFPRPTEKSRKLGMQALQRAQAKGYEWCVSRIRSPHHLPMRLGGAPVGIFEVYVHHQDVLRADPALPARAAPPELAACLPWLLAFHAKQLDDVRLEVDTDAGQWSAGAGAVVQVKGEVGEAVLWLAGRGAVASVEVEADPDVLDRLSPVTRI